MWATPSPVAAVLGSSHPLARRARRRLERTVGRRGKVRRRPPRAHPRLARALLRAHRADRARVLHHAGTTTSCRRLGVPVFEIGTSLREARLRQGLDFPEIEQGTKIRGKYLRALEESSSRPGQRTSRASSARTPTTSAWTDTLRRRVQLALRARWSSRKSRGGDAPSSPASHGRAAAGRSENKSVIITHSRQSAGLTILRRRGLDVGRPRKSRTPRPLNTRRRNKVPPKADGEARRQGVKGGAYRRAHGGHAHPTSPSYEGTLDKRSAPPGSSATNLTGLRVRTREPGG